jgi:hypothetical protein
VPAIPHGASRAWRAVSVEHSNMATSFFTKIAGVKFKGRQRIIPRCSEGEILRLVRDPTDRYDKGAIKVMRLNGEQLGFVPAHVSRAGDQSGLSFRMDRGDKYQCRIVQITGGGAGMRFGVNIEITECNDDALSSKPKPSTPVHHRNLFEETPSRDFGWFFLVAAAVIVLIILVIIRNSS